MPSEEALEESQDIDIPVGSEEAEPEITLAEISAAIDGTEADLQTQSVDTPESEPEAEAEPKPDLPSIDAPVSWDREAKEQFKAFPREAQETIVARQRQMDSDYTRKTEEVANQRRYYEGIDRVMKPYLPDMAERGVDPASLLSQAFAVDARLRADKVEGLRWLCGNLNVDPRQLLETRAPGHNGTQRPSAPAYNPEITALKQKLAGFEQEISRGRQAEQQRVVNEATQVVESFKLETDNEGNPLHPHYAEVEGEMFPIVTQLRAANPQRSHYDILKEAYEKAQWVVPGVRERLLGQQEATKRERDVQTAEAARRKASTLVGDPGGQIKANVPDDIEAALNMAWDGNLE